MKIDFADVSDMATRIASRKLKCSAKREGVWDDMYQSAYVVCLEIERKGVPRHRGYYLSAAIRAAQSECVWLQSWNKHNHPKVTIERHTHESELVEYPEPDSEFCPRFCSLARFFYVQRGAENKRNLAASIEDAKTTCLILRGYNNKEIATTLGTTWTRIAARRQSIRRRLKEELS